MKELNIEQKAKSYDKIMDRAKKELDACGSQDCEAARQIFRLFPELTESKDEKIRKEIVTYLKSVIANKGYRDIIIESWIAWLEKQGEQKPAWSREDDNCLSTIIAEFSKCAGKSVSKDEWMRCNDWLNSLRDRVQPKQEWRKEDKTITSALSQLLKVCELENNWNCVYSNDREVFFVDMENWLKSLKNRYT